MTLGWAVRLGQVAEASVCAVYASDPMAMSYRHPRGANHRRPRDHVARAAASGVEITTVVEVEYPVPLLARVADEQHAPVVVVGRKGTGHLRGVLLGRVPAQLPFHAHRPVAIVPRGASD